jgi:hypothetical protein
VDCESFLFLFFFFVNNSFCCFHVLQTLESFVFEVRKVLCFYQSHHRSKWESEEHVLLSVTGIPCSMQLCIPLHSQVQISGTRKKRQDQECLSWCF